MVITIRSKFTLFALITLLALPLSLFSQIFEKDGVKIEVTYPWVCIPKEGKELGVEPVELMIINLTDPWVYIPKEVTELGIKPVELTITNLTDKNIIINQKSIPGHNVSKDPKVIARYNFKVADCGCPSVIELYNQAMVGVTLLESLLCFSPNFALTVFGSRNLAKLVWIIQATALNMAGAKMFEYYLLSTFFESEKGFYMPDQEVSYFFGLYKKKYTWQKRIEPSQSDKVTILLDSKRNKFTFDVYKDLENSKSERIRFSVELEDNAINVLN